MPYSIYGSDGTPVSIPDNVIDNAYYNASGGGGFGPGNTPQAGHGLGLQQIGRNTTDYGAAIAQNFLQLQQNFSSSVLNYPSDATSLQGQIWFQQTSISSGSLYVKTSTTGVGLANWQQIATTGGTVNAAVNISGGLSGDLVYQSAANTTAFVTAGTSGQVLLSNGVAAPAWANATVLTVGSAGNLTGGSAGTIPYQSAAGVTAMLAAGTAGQVLSSTGAGAPVWVNNSGAGLTGILSYRGIFPTANGQDFNTLLTSGYYDIVWGNYTGTSNTPPSAATYGTLQVTAGVDFITQEFNSNATPTQTWTRSYYSGAWSLWGCSPNLTGSGATGTWAINVTGNAATATAASTVTVTSTPVPGPYSVTLVNASGGNESLYIDSNLTLNSGTSIFAYAGAIHAGSFVGPGNGLTGTSPGFTAGVAQTVGVTASSSNVDYPIAFLTAAGGNANVLTNAGELTFNPATLQFKGIPGRLESFTYYNTPGETLITIPSNASLVYVEVVGAGGGSSSTQYWGGGGAGGYTRGTFVPVSPWVYTVTVGTGGAPGTPNGGNGTGSSISGSGGTNIYANGGHGAIQASGALGGAAASVPGALCVAGSGGGFGGLISSDSIYGAGGDSYLGGGGAAAINIAVGTQPNQGSGGGGGSGGGAGGNGVVMVYVYY